MEKAYEIIELANKTGKIKKGANEATKALERGKAKFVAYAGDVNPKEIVMHIPIMAKEKGVPCFEVASKEELGAAAGLGKATTAVAVIQEGESKQLIKQVSESNSE